MGDTEGRIGRAQRDLLASEGAARAEENSALPGQPMSAPPPLARFRPGIRSTTFPVLLSSSSVSRVIVFMTGGPTSRTGPGALRAQPRAPGPGSPPFAAGGMLRGGHNDGSDHPAWVDDRGKRRLLARVVGGMPGDRGVDRLGQDGAHVDAVLPA